MSILKYFPLGGVAGPVLFALTTVICGAIRPGYDHVNQFISELGATGTSNAELMNGMGFIPSGLLIALFGISLLAFYAKGALSGIGSALIVLFGLGMITVGVFSCDPGCMMETQESVIHDKVSAVIFTGVIIGLILLGLSHRKRPEWKSLWLYSVLSAVLLAVLLALLISSAESRTGTGLWQRLFLLVLFVWMGVHGVRLYRLIRA